MYTIIYTICVFSVAQAGPILYNPIDHSLLGSSVHGIFHTRILEWTAISFYRESSQPRDGSLIAYIYICYIYI